ncbi:MAG: hypothetical protein LBQ66_12945 [Planctomycetaceae bacterium]|jgi:hypothetical protein|nr:hypothetical protein [Planctomycetaceae bacterium]
MLKKVLVFLWVFVVLTSSMLFAQDNVPDLRKHVTENSQEIWKKYLTNFKGGIAGDIKLDSFRNGKLAHRHYNHLERTKNWSLIEMGGDPQTGSKIIMSFSQSYSFKIHRSASDDQWAVDYVEKISNNALNNIENYEFPSGKETVDGLKDFVCRFYIFRCFALEPNIHLPTLMRLPEFSITQIKEIQKDGVNYYALDFSFTPSGAVDEQLILDKLIQSKSTDPSELPEGLQKYPMIAVRSGSLLLTTDYLLIKEADIEILGTGKCKIVCNYRYEENIPLISEYTMEYVKTGYKEVYSFDLSLNPVQNSRRFTLSHYGIPEPDFGERRINRIRYVLLGLGMLLIVIAVWRTIRKRRTV